MKPIGAGKSDFKTIIENECLYIDKTLLIKEIIDDKKDVLLFPRPRRFGKSLNISMLSYYFDNTLDSKKLFKGLNIMKEDKKYIKEMNSYPVIHLTLKELKKDTYEEFIVYFKDMISSLYKKYMFLLDCPNIDEIDKVDFIKFKNKEETNLLSKALLKLTSMLNEYYGKKVIILMDEYDAPIMHSYQAGIYDKVISFMKDFFSTTFKDNINLHKGVITGVLRVSKEGMFSDANNIVVYNITDDKFSSYFGFTEEEVKDVLKEYNIEENFKDVKKWYDGYSFGEHRVYNPWSIINYLDNEDHILQPYWVKTGNIDLIRELVYENNADMFGKFNKLLDEKKISGIKLDLNMDLKNLKINENTIWTLLMLSGYLTPLSYNPSVGIATLKIPNHEICNNLRDMSETFFNNNFKKRNDLLNDIIYEKLDLLEKHYNEVALESFSYYDTDKEDGESFYHGFTLGILYQLGDEFSIKSNREAGYGRSDIIVTKKDKLVGYIFELKKAYSEDLEKEVKEGLKQIDVKQYANELKDIKKVYKVAIAFSGKEIKLNYK